jgi:phosphoenolpyruvate carboxylase
VLEMVFTCAWKRRWRNCGGPSHQLPSFSDFSVEEPADYPDEAATGYAAIQRDFIDPMNAATRWRCASDR